MAEEYFPFDAGPGANSMEARWRRMARLWAPSGVVGLLGSNAYGLSVSGLIATLGRDGTTGVAEAWVDGFMHRLITSNWNMSITPNATANPRIDRLVLRLDTTANTVTVAWKPGTPAASPVPPALTQVDNGTWEIPLWSFTVPANSAAPLTNLVDERVWIDPTGSSAPQGIKAFGVQASAQSFSNNAGLIRMLGGLNVTPYLYPGRFYELDLLGLSGGASTLTFSARAISGTTPPTGTTGTQVATGSNGGGKFQVATAGFYSISAFGSATGTSGGSTSGGAGAQLALRDSGLVIASVGSTPPTVS